MELQQHWRWHEAGMSHSPASPWKGSCANTGPKNCVYVPLNCWRAEIILDCAQQLLNGRDIVVSPQENFTKVYLMTLASHPFPHDQQCCSKLVILRTLHSSNWGFLEGPALLPRCWKFSFYLPSCCHVEDSTLEEQSGPLPCRIHSSKIFRD